MYSICRGSAPVPASVQEESSQSSMPEAIDVTSETVCESPASTDEPSNLAITQPPTKKRKTGGHKVGMSLEELSKYHDIESDMAEDEDGQMKQVLYCKLCRKWKTTGLNGTTTWGETPCTYVREDKIKLHLKSKQHNEAIIIESSAGSFDRISEVCSVMSLSLRNFIFYYSFRRQTTTRLRELRK